jgi:hypothetical protein
MVGSERQKGAARWMAVIVLSLVVLGWGEIARGFTKGELRRINKEGPVEIALIYLNPIEKKAGPEPSFEVRMNTHSVDLDAYEMETLCFIRIDGGVEQKALGWFKPGGGGHHLSGVLKFADPIPSDSKSLQVIIRGVGGVPERIFEWTLPLE